MISISFFFFLLSFIFYFLFIFIFTFILFCMRKLLRESLLLLKMELSGLKYQKILNPKALILEQTLRMRMKIGFSMMKILIQKSLMLIGEKFKSQKGNDTRQGSQTRKRVS